MDSILTFAEPGILLPSELEAPFGVFLDGEDDFWSDDDLLCRSCQNLINKGCRWFVCYGPRSEAIHDRIDDVIVEQGYEGIVTTYHADESEAEVAQFFKDVALIEMKAGLILVSNRSTWARLF